MTSQTLMKSRKPENWCNRGIGTLKSLAGSFSVWTWNSNSFREPAINVTEPSIDVNIQPLKHPNIFTSLKHTTYDPLCWEIEFKSENKDTSKKMLHELTNPSFDVLYTKLMARSRETPYLKKTNILLSKKWRKKAKSKDNGLKGDGEVLLACNALDILADNLSMGKARKQCYVQEIHHSANYELKGSGKKIWTTACHLTADFFSLFLTSTPPGWNQQDTGPKFKNIQQHSEHCLEFLRHKYNSNYNVVS